MDAAYEFAKLLKERDNGELFHPLEGTVEQLPDIKIRISDKVVPGREMLRSVVDLLAQDADGHYLWQGRRVYLLPWPEPGRAGIQKYLVIGGDAL